MTKNTPCVPNNGNNNSKEKKMMNADASNYNNNYDRLTQGGKWSQQKNRRARRIKKA